MKNVYQVVIESLKSLSRDELISLEKELQTILHTCSGCNKVVRGPHACPSVKVK